MAQIAKHRRTGAGRTALAGLAILLATSACPALSSYSVCVEDLNFYPVYRTRDKQYEGFARELLDAFAQSEGIRFHYVPLPLRRLYRDFYQLRRCDFKFPANPTWLTEMSAQTPPVYSKAVVQVLEGLMVRPQDRGLRLDDFSRIGTIHGFSPWPYASHIQDGRIQVDHASSTESLVQMLLLGRVNAIFHAVPVVEHHLEREAGRPGGLVFLADAPHYRAEFMMATMEHAVLIERLDNFLVRQRARVERLKDKYGLRA